MEFHGRKNAVLFFFKRHQTISNPATNIGAVLKSLRKVGLCKATTSTGLAQLKVCKIPHDILVFTFL